MDLVLKDRRILVVEDEYLIADLLASGLADAGAIVLGPVGSLGDALELIGQGAVIDAAVLDVNLGGEMVYPAADKLVENAIPFVFTTGYDPLSIPSRFAGIGCCEKSSSAGGVPTAVAGAIEGAFRP